MKKYLLSIIFCLSLVCCLYGCKQKDSEKEQETASTQATEFEKPDDYATVVTVSINPVFNLYLNEQNEVLAIEPVNNDAKSIIDEIKCEDKNINAVVKEIVKCTDENGFLKKDATVDIKVTETTISEEAQSELVAVIEDEMTKEFKQVNVKVSVALKDKKQEAEKEEKKDSNSAAEDNKQVAQKEEKKDSDSNKTTTHTHQYSNATCTKPQTCSCGATKSSALGHNYVEGECTRCKEKDPNFKYPSLASMKGKWVIIYAARDEQNGVREDSYIFGEKVETEEWYYLLEGYDKLGHNNCIMWNNQHYCRRAGGMIIEYGRFSESNNTVTIIDDYNKKMVLQRTSTNTMKVLSTEEGFTYGEAPPVGTVMTFVANN